jgi:protein-S-isoprenylcysteine O-methyltransferase Ste14
MPHSNPTQGERSRILSLPRWALITGAVAVVLVLLPLVLVILPWAISVLTPRLGWTRQHPSTLNLLGLLPVIVGYSVNLWTYVLHLASAPQRVELVLAPSYLVTRGPYRFSRNPMYVATMAIYLGWTFFYGSLAVLILAAVWAVVYAFMIVPREEHALQARHGDTYLQYKAKVPRWLGKRRP